ncbi:hypothetical protein [Actinospica robiniae]|uniref:hypothetical protein n=1 Tax=Actinospica robiniae TaxID=304901 RepID=UPI000554EB5F|nr:hypothetical protein [Actinospica robiniae]
MDVSELEPQDAPPQPTGCPVCGRGENVQKVSGAVANGWRLPAATPQLRYEWSPVLVVVGCGGIVQFGLSILNGSDGPAFVGFGIMGWVLGLGLRKSVSVFKRRRRVRPGRTAALAVWNGAWLCARCGIVYFQPGYEPAGVGLSRPLTYLEFQAEVYGVGGYRDLADGNEG